MRRRILLLGVVVAPIALVGVIVLASSGDHHRGKPAAAAASDSAPGPDTRSHRPQVIEPPAGIVESNPAGGGGAGAPSAREVSKELADAQRAGKHGRVPSARPTADGLAEPPPGAPSVVARVIRAANLAARDPYTYGGGHGSYNVRYGYDCSASVSYALTGAGLLKGGPLDSTGLASWGKPGPGRWITVYANAGHTFMIVAGLRYDTSGRQTAGTRWQAASRSTSGFVARHPQGL